MTYVNPNTNGGIINDTTLDNILARDWQWGYQLTKMIRGLKTIYIITAEQQARIDDRIDALPMKGGRAKRSRVTRRNRRNRRKRRSCKGKNY